MQDRSGYFSADTIAALSSQVGGAIAIIRLSGPGTRAILGRLAGPEAMDWEPRRAYRALLRGSSGEAIDDSICLFFQGPASYTGEDLAELQIHGSAYLARRVLEELGKIGARQALPGEFSFRAVRNGKLNLSQAQAVADLIEASNGSAVSLALEKLQGSQSQLVKGLADRLRNLAVLGEIGIDFSDQDVEEVSLPVLRARVQPVIEDLIRLQETFQRGIRVQEGVSVAFIGLPNAGKSSFFNALLGEDRSIVSEIAGTTRDVVRERLTLQGRVGSVTLRLEDTAGLRATEDQIERIGIERTQRAAKGADILIVVVDASSEIRPLFDEWKRIGVAPQKALGILTKVDLVSPEALGRVRREVQKLGVETWCETSVIRGQGIQEAAVAISDFAETLAHRDAGEVLLTRLDHKEAVQAAISHLTRAVQAPEIDLFAADLKQALFALSPLIGETLPDDILGRIFSEFCIGK